MSVTISYKKFKEENLRSKSEEQINPLFIYKSEVCRKLTAMVDSLYKQFDIKIASAFAKHFLVGSYISDSREKAQSVYLINKQIR